MGRNHKSSRGYRQGLLKAIPLAISLVLILFLSVSTALSLSDIKNSKQELFSVENSIEALQDSLLQLETESEKYLSQINTLTNVENRVRMKFGLSPINNAERNLSTGGRPSLETEARLSLESADIRSALGLKKQSENVLGRLRLIDSITNRVCSHIEKEIAFRNEYPSIWPVEGRITSAYGLRDHPILSMRKFHDGIDIKGPMWTPIIAPADGVVKYVGWRKGYGKTVEVMHKSSGYYTRYAHLADMKVEVGDVVKRGEQIGYLGNSGQSTGAHLHYEIRKEDRGGRTLNPRNFLPKETLIYD